MPVRKQEKKLVVINALHTNGGGGLVYLQNLLPELVKDERFRWRLVTTAAGLAKLMVPPEMDVWRAPSLRFGLSHLWEQFVLPVKVIAWGAALVWSNANYGPLLARRPLVTIHTTPRAAAAWPGVKWWLYWKSLWLLTVLCLLRAPAAFSVAWHVLPDFIFWSERARGKVRIAPPAVLPNQRVDGAVEAGLVVTVGDFYHQKQYPVLLRALAVLREKRPDVRLKIVGRPVFTEVVAEVERTIAALELAGTVEIVPGLPHAELMQLLGTAAVYVNTSSAECFNMPVLEALSVGAPVVTGDYAFQREVAGEAAVYVPQGGDQAAAYAVALYGVLENTTLADSLRRRGRERAAGFSWAATARVMTETFAQVAGLKS